MAKPKSEAPSSGGGPNMTDAQEQNLFANNQGKYERLLKAKKAADKALQDHGKIIKSEHGEHGLLMIKTSIALRDEATGANEREKADAVIKVMRWHGEPVGVQGSLFEANDGDMTPEERAYAAGKRTGVQGGSMSAPVEYAAGDVYQAWCKGWHDGQTSIFAIKATSDTVN